MQTLRKMVESKSGEQFFVDNKDNIMFELNHLELHGLDEYVLSMLDKGFTSDSNPNNSNIAYLLGITPVEPLGRITTVGGTLPDIDSDLAQSGRELIFDYLRNKYGHGYAHVGTVMYSGGKKAFKDAARIHSLDFGLSNKISAMISDKESSLVKNLEMNEELRALYESNPNIKEIYDDAISFEGAVASTGVHASAVIISDDPIYDHIPLWESRGEPVAQFDGHDCEEVGFVKVDILGLKALDILSFCRDLIEKRYGTKLDYYSIPIDDIDVFKTAWKGLNLGIFQCEAQGISDFMNKCEPKSIHDLSVIIAAYRPGPMGMPGFLDRIAGKINGTVPVGKFIFPEFSHIFESSKNELVMQEQFMRLAIEMCGYSEIESDSLRRATAKKNLKDLQAHEKKFIDGAVKNGQDRAKVEEFWQHLLAFSSYSFNASHALSYSYITYFCLYLKTYYPIEFYTSIISTETDVDQKSIYINDAKKRGIPVVPPSVNESETDFTITKNNEIVFGLNGVKNIGTAIYKDMINIRPFSSVTDFFLRTYLLIPRMNSKAWDTLILCGGLDIFGYKRATLFTCYRLLHTEFDPKGVMKKKYNKTKILDEEVILLINTFLDRERQIFNDQDYKEYSLLDMLEKEKELIGIYASGDPFEVAQIAAHGIDYKEYRDAWDKFSSTNLFNGKILFRINNIKVIKTKNGDKMAFIDAVDSNKDTFSLTVFPDTYASIQDSLETHQYYIGAVLIKQDARGVGSFLNGITPLFEKFQDVAKTINKKNVVKKLEVEVEQVQGIVKIKTIFTKLRKLLDEHTQSDNPTLDFTVDLNVPSLNTDEKVYFNLINTRIDQVSIDSIRELNSIPEIKVAQR